MSDLTDFLLARIAEDERLANGQELYNIPSDCWGPDRVLAECEAKWRIVELHGRVRHQCVAEDGPTQWHVGDPCATVRVLAAAYADHPDYRAEWKP